MARAAQDILGCGATSWDVDDEEAPPCTGSPFSVVDNGAELKTPLPWRLSPLKLDSISAASTCSSTASQDPSVPSSGELSPCSCRSASTTPRHYLSDQTIIIFDWDDTLCPTTVCAQRVPLGSDADGSGGGGEPSPISSSDADELAPVLADVAREAVALFTRASELADKVAVVTNAGEGWVEWSCTQWLPGLLPALQQVEVVSARSTWEPLGVASPTSWKERTFREIIERFYSRYPNQSWKNIVCVGDAPYEHEALGRVVGMEQNNARVKRCRTKSVKFMPQPSAECLVHELQMLREGLEEIVSQDQDMYHCYLTASL